MQQRFRRDASAIQAHAPGILFPVDQGDLHSEICRKKRRGITTRPAADYCNVQIGILSHEFCKPRRARSNTKEDQEELSFVLLRVLRGYFLIPSSLSLYRKQERLLKRFRNPPQEARRVGAVNQPMIVRQRQRQHLPRLEL